MFRKPPLQRDLGGLAGEAERRGKHLGHDADALAPGLPLLIVTSSILAAVAGATALTQVGGAKLAGVLALMASALMAGAASLEPGDRATDCAKKATRHLQASPGAARARTSADGVEAA
jgi:hypothetical protein